MRRALLITLRMLTCCGCLHGAMVSANPIPADEQSLQNGADAYDLHCAVCHGSYSLGTGEQWYETNEYDVTPDFTYLVEQVEAEKAAKAAQRAKESWPEWAEIPDPGNKADDAEVRAAILEDMSRAVDAAYGTGDESDDGGSDQGDSLDTGAASDSRDDEEALSDRLDGATDLADPETFVYGTTEEELFNSIAEGFGSAMPGWRSQLQTDEAIWDLVNFIHSLWGEEWQDF